MNILLALSNYLILYKQGEISMEATRELLEYEIVNETMTVGETNQFMSSLQVSCQDSFYFCCMQVVVENTKQTNAHVPFFN